MTWCKLNGTTCVKLEGRHTSWKQEKNLSFFILHFEPVLPSDNGSYRCSANFLSAIIESHSTTLYVTGEFSISRPSDIFLIMFPGRGGFNFLSDYVRKSIPTAHLKSATPHRLLCASVYICVCMCVFEVSEIEDSREIDNKSYCF